MDIQKRRCVYCGNTYDYIARGGYRRFSIHDDRFCPTCMGIIETALHERYPKDMMLSHKPFPIDGLDDTLIAKMKQIKERERNKWEDRKKESNDEVPLGMPFVGVYIQSGFDTNEVYCINHRIYYVCYNRGDEDDKRYFIELEYCPSTNEIGHVYVDYDNCYKDNSMMCGINLLDWLMGDFKAREVKKIEPIVSDEFAWSTVPSSAD